MPTSIFATARLARARTVAWSVSATPSARAAAGMSHRRVAGHPFTGICRSVSSASASRLPTCGPPHCAGMYSERRRVIERMPVAEKLAVGDFTVPNATLEMMRSLSNCAGALATGALFFLRRNMPHLDCTVQGGGHALHKAGRWWRTESYR